MKRVPIRRKEAKNIMESASKRRISFLFEKFELAEVAELDKEKVLLIDSTPTLIIFENGSIIPHLQGLGKVTRCPVVVVDDGAKKPVLNGADVMMPGIVKHTNFSKNDAVAIFSKDLEILAVGIALVNSSEISGKGKAVQNLHRLNDRFYNLFK